MILLQLIMLSFLLNGFMVSDPCKDTPLFQGDSILKNGERSLELSWLFYYSAPKISSKHVMNLYLRKFYYKVCNFSHLKSADFYPYNTSIRLGTLVKFSSRLSYF